MILTPHAIVGAAIVNIFPDHPVIGFSLAFASHYLLDLIPHKEYHLHGFIDENAKTVASVIGNFKSTIKSILSISFDFIIGIILSSLFFISDSRTFYLTLLGVAAGVLPDFFQFLYLKYKREPWIWFQKIHDYFHSEDKMEDKPIKGYLIQVSVSLIFIIIYFLLK